MISIKDVAQKAGVSISTVSLAYNSPVRVSDATREKIYQAAKELGYIPASIAKKNVLKEKNSVAVIMGSLIGPFWIDVLRGINETLSVNKMEMVLFSGNDSFQKHFRSLIQDRTCKGIIVITDSNGDDQMLQMAADEEYPIVLCCPPAGHEGISSAMIDNWNIGQQVANYFIQMRRKDIALFGKCPKDCPDRERGFLDALRKNGIDVPSEWKVYCDVTEEDAYEATKEFLKKHQKLPDAIFAVNDETAIGVMQALHEEKIKVPEEISVIGCDNISIGRFIQPLLTTIEMPRFEIGILTANMLLRRIAGMPPEHIVLNGKLIIRDSCCKKDI